jgi:hypothetical protein
MHDPKDAVGKYPLHEIAHGKSLLVADLSPRSLPNGLTGRSILRVSIKHAGAFDPWRLPLEVTLLFVPQRDHASGPIQLPHSYVLATKDAGDVTLAWVAVENGRIAEIAAAAAHSDVFTMVEGNW